MSRPPLFRTKYVFTSPVDAVEFFNAERAEGIDRIPNEVAEFLERVADYDPEALFNVQPAFKTHYVAVAHPDDHHLWLFAKPSGVVFQLGDERNVAAIEEFLDKEHLEETPGANDAHGHMVPA